MSLATSIQHLVKQPLSAEELEFYTEYEKTYEIAADDPLFPFLAMQARTAYALEIAPQLLREAVNETIEQHKTLLRDQAVTVTKELIQDIAAQIMVVHNRGKKRFQTLAIAFTCGCVFMTATLFVARLIAR